MIFITPVVSRAVAATKDFIARGLEDLTVGKVGDVAIFGRANSQQLAYDGYKANIECFIQATASKSKVLTQCDGFIFPEEYTFSAPFSLPRTVFKLSGNMSQEQRERFETSLGKEGLEKVDGKDQNLYTIQRPTPQTIKKLMRVAHPRTIFLTDYAQLEGTHDLLPVFNYLDAFLATNTYSYKRSDFEQKASAKRILNAEIRHHGQQWYREGFGAKSGFKKIALDKEAPKDRAIDQHETEDLTPYMDTELPQTLVYVAKPSLNPSSASYGHPSAVPNKSGLVFPYFDGMLLADTGFVRRSVSTFFLRLMGETTKAAHNSFATLRKTMGTATTTPQGVVLSHVLMGIDLALQTQTQVFLLYDNQTYLGFVLLGEEFTISLRGKVYEPLTPELLRQELLEIHTHDSAIASLVELLKKCTFTGGDTKIELDSGDIETCPLLLNQLADIDTEKTEKGDIEKVSEMLKRLNFPGDYLSYKPDNIAWAVTQMTTMLDIDLIDEKVFIPIKEWKGMDKKVAQVLACFGPRAPSFIDPKGKEIAVRAGNFFGEYEGEGRTRKRVHDRFIVYEKVLSQAVKDWGQLEKNDKMKLNLEERAVGSRGHVFNGTSIDVIWAALKAGSEARSWGELGGVEEKPVTDKGKKRKRDDDVAGPSMTEFDDLF